jgi:hypothetical protein
VDNPLEDLALDLMPSDDALRILHELTSSYGRRILRMSEMLTEAQRHAITHGHPLAFGCCRVDREEPTS